MMLRLSVDSDVTDDIVSSNEACLEQCAFYVITSTKEDMFCLASVCLFVCLYVCLSVCKQDDSNSCWRILTNIFGGVQCVTG